MSNEPVLIRAVIAAVVTAVVGVLVGKGVIAEPSAGQTAALVTGIAGVLTVAQAWLARRKVSPVAKGSAGG